MAPSPFTATRRPVPDDLFGGRLKGAYLLDLEVVAVDDVTPTTRAITFASPDLVDFGYLPGQDLMMTFPAGDRTARRRYTVRSNDPAAGTAVVEFVVHGHGPASDWAGAARPGDRIEAIGPRGTIALAADAVNHLFIGDESAVPATFIMLEALPATATATAILEVDDPASERPAPTTAASISVQWVATGAIPAAIAGLHLPAGPSHAYVHGEAAMVRAARQALADIGLTAESISTKAYWRHDQANADHGEPNRL
jgi:NADPH-dependent ferric siderophore reductase